MRIGILTFHNAHNCGACLQAYALKKYLENKGHDSAIIDYQNEAINNFYPKKKKISLSLYNFKHLHDIFKKYRLWKNIRYGSKSWSTQYAKFDTFIKEELLDQRYIMVDFNQLHRLNIDLFIAGSDQIWNKKLTKKHDDAYFLNFDTNALKCFYAASNGYDKIPDEDIIFYKSALRDRSIFISTREALLANDLSIILKKRVTSVVDPCFLLDSEEYIKLTKKVRKHSTMVSKKPYVFLYQINETNRSLTKAARIIADALNIGIVEFHYDKTREYKKDFQRSDFGPLDFLDLIINANFVITNSFHGIVFSLIFKKQFYSIYSKDSRKDNLLKQFKLDSRHIINLSQIDLNKRIDYSQTDIKSYRKNSEKYLDKVLNYGSNSYLK